MSVTSSSTLLREFHVTPELFLQIADLLREPTLMVTVDGDVVAANRSARREFALKARPTKPLETLFHTPETSSLSEFLRDTARSRDPTLATLRPASSANDQTLMYRCHGALLSPRTGETAAMVMLRLTPNDHFNQPFIALNQKLDELAEEVEQRKLVAGELERHLALTEFGRDFGLALTESVALDEMLQRCTDLLVRHLNAAFARIWVTDESGDLLILRASSGLYTHLDGAHSTVPVGKLKIGYIAESQRPHLTNQVIGDPRVNEQQWARQEGMVAFAGYPLIVDGNTVGVMAIFAKHELSESAISAMGSVANELAVGIARKQAEERLLQKAAALELADARKNEFLAMLAHELRNPLAPIRSGLELLQAEYAENDVIPVMQTQLEHMVRMVDDLLDVSRIMRGRIEMKKRPTPFHRILERSVSTVRPVIKEAGHELVLQQPPADWWVNGDDVRLTQVLINLLHNAAKYTPEGGRIEVKLESDDRTLRVSVVDNGIGIDTEFAPELFTLFAQAARGLDRSQGGLGIGLTLVKQIVTLHGGEVDAVSDGHGCGSTFSFTLPLTAPQDVDPESEPPTEVDVPPFKILVVDDNVASAKILARLLQKNWEHEIRVTHDGSAALQKVKEEAPDIIFLDIGLPGLSGYEVAREIRNRPNGDEIFIVALTGYGTLEDRRKSADAGFNVHLVKPIGLEDLQGVFRMRVMSN